MTILDLRSSPFTNIVVDEPRREYYNVTKINSLDNGMVQLSHDDIRSISLIDEEHARMIIKGIEKAIELGWFKK